ncbi:MAG: glutamate 5-kinase [Myxococcales bacterium]|nr:glutamate 5-kinase [Myxococcales bacterium]
MKRDFSNVKRLVIKIGTNTLSKDGKINIDYIESVAGQVASIKSRGIKPLLVSSGAIGFGASELGIEKRITKTRLKQACAAVGQPMLMHRYRLAFQQFGIPIGQVLITKDNFDNRDTSVNLRTSVETLLELGVVPIFNENDCVSTREIAPYIGDNDQLSAYIASNLDAELLIILTDIDALYDKNPRQYPDAKPIHYVEKLTDEIFQSAGDAGSTFSTGGMKTKLKAVAIAAEAGCHTVLAHGAESRILARIIDGEKVGTWFAPGERLSNRVRWILNSTPHGFLEVDAGAEQALESRKSLLPSGIRHIEGEFNPGDVILINRKFKAVAGSSSSDMRRIMGRHSKDAADILGREVKRDVISRSSDIVRVRPFFNEE